MALCFCTTLDANSSITIEEVKQRKDELAEEIREFHESTRMEIQKLKGASQKKHRRFHEEQKKRHAEISEKMRENNALMREAIRNDRKAATIIEGKHKIDSMHAEKHSDDKATPRSSYSELNEKRQIDTAADLAKYLDMDEPSNIKEERAILLRHQLMKQPTDLRGLSIKRTVDREQNQLFDQAEAALRIETSHISTVVLPPGTQLIDGRTITNFVHVVKTDDSGHAIPITPVEYISAETGMPQIETTTIPIIVTPSL